MHPVRNRAKPQTPPEMFHVEHCWLREGILPILLNPARDRTCEIVPRGTILATREGYYRYFQAQPAIKPCTPGGKTIFAAKNLFAGWIRAYPPFLSRSINVPRGTFRASRRKRAVYRPSPFAGWIEAYRPSPSVELPPLWGVKIIMVVILSLKGTFTSTIRGGAMPVGRLIEASSSLTPGPFIAIR